MKADRQEKFDIFQIHDGRKGCAPPLKVTVLVSGRIELISDVKKKTGSGCIRGKLSRRASRGKIRRDGTEQKLEILIEFDGRGGFDVTVWIDGVQQSRGRYKKPTQKTAFRSRHFYFKHGVYSRSTFEYELISRGMSVRKVRVK